MKCRDLTGRNAMAWVGLILCPSLLLGGVIGGETILRRRAVEEGHRLDLVLRDVRVEERAVTVSSGERFRVEAMVEAVGGEEGAGGSRPALAGGPSAPLAFSLSQNYPNPFNPSTTIAFSVPEGEALKTTLRVYDIRGRLVRVLVDELYAQGQYRVHWNGRTEEGEPVASGIYLYELRQGDKVQTRKMTVVR